MPFSKEHFENIFKNGNLPYEEDYYDLINACYNFKEYKENTVYDSLTSYNIFKCMN